MKEHFLKRTLFGVILAAVTVVPAKADDLYARIRGSISDPSGRRVPGVQVTATNDATGATRQFASGPDGSYELINLPVGTYRLSATKGGFKTFNATGIVLTVNQVFVLDISLTLGQVSETVDVRAEEIKVEATSMQLGAVVNGESIVDLPLNGRDWIQLQQLQPGVVSQSDRRADTYATNGSQAQQNSFLINGADSNNFFGNTPAIIPSPDAIAEFRMVTNTLNPEYGRNSGAIMNAIVKSGANQFHGSLFEFYRDTSLNATRWFLQTPDVLHRNQFGGTFGGPVWKDHTFFFLSYQGTRESRAENITDYGGSAPLGFVQVFTQAQLGGNFSQGSGCPFGPNTSPIPFTDYNGVVQPAGTPYCTLWPNGIVPTTDYNSVATNLVARYVPLPNSGVSGYSFNPIHTDSDNQGLFRIDHSFDPQNSIWGYGLIEPTTGLNALPFFGATLPGFAGTADRHAYQFAVSWNHVFSATTLNELRTSYTRSNMPFAYPVHPQLPSSLGFTGIVPQDPTNAGVPSIFVSGFFGMGDSPEGPEDEVGNTYQITDNLSRVSGRHSLKFGLAVTRFEYNHYFVGPNNGDFTFAGGGAYSTGNPGLDFLLGIPDSYTQGSSNTTRARGYEYYVFAQDQYRVRNDLTLTYGLGWQIDTPLSNLTNHSQAINCFRPGEQSSVYPTAPAGLTFPGDPGCTPSGYETHYGHLGPRIGFAWSPDAGRLSGGPGKLSIRGGFGIYFNRSEDQPVLQSIFAPPYSLFSFGIGGEGGSPSFAAPFTDIAGLVPPITPNPFPYTIPSAATANFSEFEPLTLTVTDPNFTVPYAENYNLTVERELPAKMIVSLGYVGAVAHHLLVERELNPGLNPQGCAANPTCVQFRSIQQLLFPNNFQYPGDIFGSVGEQTTTGNSNYNSFQASVRNSPSHGLQFSAAYTWSHSLDIGSNFEDTGLSTRALNPFNPRANYGDSLFDARQRFVAYYSYEIPGGKAGRGLVPLLTRDWEISGITTVQTGFPITISSPGSYTSLTCSSFEFYGCWDVPNVTGPVQIYGNPRTSPNNLWFNPNAFSEPPFGVIGNARRNFFHGPGLNETDLVIHKWIQFGKEESQRLELRLEAFNVFNHAQFNNPDGSFTDGIPPNGTFGRVLSAGPPRVVQVAGKIYF